MTPSAPISNPSPRRGRPRAPLPSATPLAGAERASGHHVASAMRLKSASLDAPYGVAPAESAADPRCTAAAAFTNTCFAVSPGKNPFTTITPPSVSIFCAKSSMRSFLDPNPYSSRLNSDCSSCHHLAYCDSSDADRRARSFRCPTGSRPRSSLTVSSSARSSAASDASDVSFLPLVARYPRPPRRAASATGAGRRASEGGEAPARSNALVASAAAPAAPPRML